MMFSHLVVTRVWSHACVNTGVSVSVYLYDIIVYIRIRSGRKMYLFWKTCFINFSVGIYPHLSEMKT